MMDSSPPPSPQPAVPDWDTLARRFAGESPEAEARAVAAWLAEHPEDAALLARLTGAADRVTAPPPLADAEIDVEAALGRVRARREQTAAPRAEPRVVPLRPRGAERGAFSRWRLPLGLA